MTPFFDSSQAPVIPWTPDQQTRCITGAAETTPGQAYNNLITQIQSQYQTFGQLVVLDIQVMLVGAGRFQFIAIIAQMQNPTGSITLLTPGARVGS